MLDRWGQVICTSLKWSNHPHLEIVLDKRSYKWNPRDGWEQPANLWRLCCCSSAFSRCLACLHTWLFPTARWPKFDLSISQRFLLNVFSYCQHYSHSLGSESFFLSSPLPEIEITTTKKNPQPAKWGLSWLWKQNQEVGGNNLFSSACVTNLGWSGAYTSYSQVKRVTHKKGCGGKQRGWEDASAGPKRNLGSCVIAAREERVRERNWMLCWPDGEVLIF